MRLLWRISNYCNLHGSGGEKSDGRWHTASRGRRIVYLSEYPALALVEVLANLKGDPRLFPHSFQLMKVVVRDSVSTNVLAPNLLSSNWRDDLVQTRAIGDAWLAQGNSVLFGVPSVPSPESVNYLFSPLHPDAKYVETGWCKWIEYDKRLFHLADAVMRR